MWGLCDLGIGYVMKGVCAKDTRRRLHTPEHVHTRTMYVVHKPYTLQRIQTHIHNVYVSVLMCTSRYVCVRVYATHKLTYTFTVHVYIYVSTCVYIYIYIYVCVSAIICVRVYMYVHVA